MLGAEVLHELIRLEHVAADLAAEADALLFTLNCQQLVFAFLALDIGQPRLQHGHGLRSVLELAALDLTRHGDACRLVDQAYGRARLVDVLTAGARRAEHLHLDLGFVDLDVDVALVQQRHDGQRGEGGLPLALRVEGAHSDQPVHPALGLQPAVRVPALHDELDGRQTGFVARRRVFFLDIEAVPLRPSHVHAIEHLGPVLRVGAALT